MSYTLAAPAEDICVSAKSGTATVSKQREPVTLWGRFSVSYSC